MGPATGSESSDPDHDGGRSHDENEGQDEQWPLLDGAGDTRSRCAQALDHGHGTDDGGDG